MKNSPYEPDLIEVTAPDGKPSTMTIRKKHLQVINIVNIWRIDEDWWRTPVSRLYFLLDLENGTRITVFKDLIHGTWHRQNWA
jgi:hypothetical protein